MSPEPTQAAVIVVAIGDDDRAHRLHAALVDSTGPADGAAVRVVRAPGALCRGELFGGAVSAQERVAAWWAGVPDIPSSATVVCVVDPAVATTVGVLDVAVVPVGPDDAAVVTAALESAGPAARGLGRAHPGTPLPGTAVPAATVPAAPAPTVPHPGIGHRGTPGTAPCDPQQPDPLAPGGGRRVGAPTRPRLAQLLAGRRSAALMEEGIPLLLGGLPRVPVIVVCNPKGGPGKTTTAIGIALTLDAMLATARVNGRVALIDGNTRMSDTFRSMPVRPGATTVRSLVDVICNGAPGPPALQYANEEARHLVVLPEQEDGGGYRLREVEDLARWLRSHVTAVVVDLVNDVPGTGSPTERLVQWWLLQADAAVIPAKANLNDLEGARRMTLACRPVPALVAFLRPRERRLHTHPRVVDRLDHLAGLGADIVDVPEDVRVRMAALDNLNLTAAGPGIRRAFIELTTTALLRARAREMVSP